MKNSLADLNNYLFMQIERLDDEKLEGDKLKEEIERVEKIVRVADAVINNGNLILKACIAAENQIGSNKAMQLLTGENSDGETSVQQKGSLVRKK